MLPDYPVYQDTFNLLCGKKIGEGLHRKVFECRIRDDLVVKVEDDPDWRYFANVLEMKFWNDHEYCKEISKWLAPCEFLSPDGRILLQKKVQPIVSGKQLPKKMPSFLTDMKVGNYGIYNGRIVCVDYAMTIPNPSLRLRKAEWSNDTKVEMVGAT